MSKVATVERILNVRPHPNADKLDLIDILGWQVVSQKGQGHVPGNLVVYINIDSIVKPHEVFKFLESSNYRIKTVRLRGEVSNGLILPLSVLSLFDPSLDLNKFNEGDDISEIIGAKHYEKQIDAKIAGFAKGNLPKFLRKTDEDNARNYKGALNEMILNCGKQPENFYVTQKIDGSSASFYYDGENFGVCSRSLDLKEDDQNVFWRMFYKYNIKEVLTSIYQSMKPNSPHKLNVFIQGEVYGPKINGNQLGETEVKFAFFNIGYNYNDNNITMELLDFDSLVSINSQFNLPMVPILDFNQEVNLENLIAFANKQKYPNGNNAEGIVIRPKQPFYSTILNKFASLKVMNEFYKERDDIEIYALDDEE